MKKLIMPLIVSVILLGFSGSINAQPIAHYAFDGDILDSSGGDNDAESSSDLTWINDRFGNPNHAASINGYVEIPTSLIYGISEMTISTWFYLEESYLFKSNDIPNYTLYAHNIFVASNANASSKLGLEIGNFTSEIEPEMFGAIGRQGAGYPRSGVSTSSFGTTVSAGWHHIVMVTDDTGHAYYFDGERYAPDLFSVWNANSNLLSPSVEPSDFYIGYKGNRYNGIGIDDFIIYDEALTDAQIQDLYTPIPEPATMLLLSSGLVGLAGFRRKYKRS